MTGQMQRELKEHIHKPNAQEKVKKWILKISFHKIQNENKDVMEYDENKK